MKTYLVIPYEELSHAKKLAGQLSDGKKAIEFDRALKLWFAHEGADLDKLKDYLPNDIQTSQSALTPAQEFADTLLAAGFELNGLPVMDGKIHRVRVEGDKGRDKSGAYVGHIDGFPNGWYENHRDTQGRVKWKPGAAKPSPEAMAHIRAQTAQRALEREVAIMQEHNHAALACQSEYQTLPDVVVHDYLSGKGIASIAGLKIDNTGNLVIPLHNVHGELRTLQRIAPHGEKRLVKGGEKAGSFFVVGGSLQPDKPLLLAEGFATAASLTLATGHPVVMTVDAGNLVTVAQLLHQHYPRSPVVIFADNDQQKAENKGIAKANEAALLTGGQFIAPQFTADEIAKGFTDFNDLHQSRGLAALQAQVIPVIAPFIQHQETVTMTNQAQPEHIQDNVIPEQPPITPPVIEEEETQQPTQAAEAPDVEEKPLPVPPVNEAPYQEEENLEPAPQVAPVSSSAQPDGILIELPQQASRTLRPIDLDALRQNITHKLEKDKVHYSVAGVPAFVDHGPQIVMAGEQASQNPEMILAALMVAIRTRGAIELTGSDEFKERAINLIAEYNMDVRLKNVEQQMMLDNARLALEGKQEPVAEDSPTPLGTPTNEILLDKPSALPADMPEEFKPKTAPVEPPKNEGKKTLKEGVTGKILAFGPAPYKFQKGAEESFYVKLRTEKGERVLWGKMLFGALNDAGLNVDDMATLTLREPKPVTITVPMRDKEGQPMVNDNGEPMKKTIHTHVNEWHASSAIDNNLVVKHTENLTAPGELLAYDMTHYQSLQQVIKPMLDEAGVKITLPQTDDGCLWMKPNGQGAGIPDNTPSQLHFPKQTQDAGTVLINVKDEEEQLKMLLIKGLGDYVQGVVHYKGEYCPVLGKVCTNEAGNKYIAINAITDKGLVPIANGNAINNKEGAFNAFVFKFKDEDKKVYAPLFEVEKCPPALHKQLGFTHEYKAVDAKQSRDKHEHQQRQAPRPQ